MFLARDASSPTVITIFFLLTAIVFSKQSMQAQDNNDLGDPHFHDQLQDGFFLSSGYDEFTDGITGSNDQADNDMSPISRFLHITAPQYTTTTGLPQLLMDETGAAPSSSSSIPTPGPSSTSKPLDAGDNIHPLIPYSAQLDSFYHPPVPQLPAESSQPERPERQRRPRPCITPYFIPEPRVSWPSQPTTTMAALETMQPAMAPITISAAVQPATPALVVINVRPDVKKQIVDRAKRRIARFVLMTFAMAGTDDEKAALVSLVISEATSVPGMNVTIKTTSSQRQQVTVAWNNTFRKLLAMVRSCLALGYSFYPPVDSSLTPVQFRGRVITALINDTRNPLAFMHKFTVDADGNVTILDGVLNNPLIFHIAIHFIWCSDLSISEFLSTSTSDRLQQLNYAIAAIGAVAKLVLREQTPHPPVILPFTQLEGSETFDDIMCHISNLDHVQKIMFDYQKSHMLNVGDSQVLSTNVLAQLDMMMTRVE
ncbi:hypothetical protein EV424DRAFT_1347197 [Suillus variegatus]|nr:hypothetical protein EV424DRAFT_1347197 [Suillus variegatus]